LVQFVRASPLGCVCRCAEEVSAEDQLPCEPAAQHATIVEYDRKVLKAPRNKKQQKDFTAGASCRGA